MKLDYDVAIVGYGPIGEMAAIMLGRRGYKVAVFDRWPEIYRLPRAVVYDDEIAGLFEREGLLDDVLQITDPVPDFYEWRNRDGDALLKIDWSLVGPTGRPVANFFSQPELQDVLDRRARQTPGVDVRLGWEVQDMTETADGVEVVARRGEITEGQWVATDEALTLSVKYVIGADGANSRVRSHIGVEWEDLGFEFDWLICDLKPHEKKVWSPMNWQLCDPARPTTIVSGGPGRRRWEFMRLPGESIDELNTDARAWELLEPWGRTPENTTLERHAVYRFEAKWAQQWRKGRFLLAGDAAHLMPPFAGQGMCSGMRDLANLVWKLDLVMKGTAPDALLDTYGPERSTNVQHFIHFSMALGKVICVLDEEEAARRDERMIAGGAHPAKVLPEGPPPRLGEGVLRDQPVAGMPMAMGNARRGKRTALLDTLVEPGFLLLAADESAVAELDQADRDFLERVGGHVEVFGSGLEDPDGFYSAWFAAQDAVAVLVRPDAYVFGAATTPADARALVTELREDLALSDAR